MPDPLQGKPERYVYRRVKPDARDPLTGEVTSAAFTLRDDEKGLSVFYSDMQTARGVRDEELAELIAKLGVTSDRKKKKSLTRYIEKLDQQIKDGEWIVVKLPVAAFPTDHFTLGDPEQNGHLEVIGERGSFLTYADDWAEIAEIEPIDEAS